MEYKDYIHVELENGKVRLLAQIGVDLEVPKEECEKLSTRNPADIGLLVQEWIQKGYVKATARGDSYFVDCKWADHEYFDLKHLPITLGEPEIEKKKPGLDAMMEQAVGRISKAETSKDIAKETELQRD